MKRRIEIRLNKPRKESLLRTEDQQKAGKRKQYSITATEKTDCRVKRRINTVE